MYAFIIHHAIVSLPCIECDGLSVSVDEFASELTNCLSVDEFASGLTNCLSVDEFASEQ